MLETATELTSVSSPENPQPETVLPQTFMLEANYPNPFNPTTTIGYAIPEAAQVSLKIFDMLGREITTLAEGGMEPGRYVVEWNGRDLNGSSVGSGVYIYRMTATSASGKTFSGNPEDGPDEIVSGHAFARFFLRIPKGSAFRRPPLLSAGRHGLLPSRHRIGDCCHAFGSRRLVFCGGEQVAAHGRNLEPACQFTVMRGFNTLDIRGGCFHPAFPPCVCAVSPLRSSGEPDDAVGCYV